MWLTLPSDEHDLGSSGDGHLSRQNQQSLDLHTGDDLLCKLGPNHFINDAVYLLHRLSHESSS